MRSFYEERLGRDLSSVRVHTGAASVARTHEVDAHAFTYGDHVWLGRDHAPNVSFVMAHELAHVVQQTSPPTTVTTARALSQSQRVIQRLGGAYYIIPTISGATHSNDLQNAMVRQHSVSKEVKIPNATRGSTAAAFSTRRGNRVSGNGAADLYRANKKIGVYFEAGPTGTSCPDGTPAGKPRNMTRGGRPYVNQRARLTGATEAPTEIALGEVKPADPDAMTFATDQLEAYKRGIRFARQKANCWWSANNSASATAPQWNAITLSNMAGLSIPSGWQYSATSTGTNTVAIGTWEGWGNGRIRTRTLFNPATNGLPRIQGRVYAVEADGRPGVYVYFVRPNDPEGLLRSVSGSAQRRAWVTEAGRVQRQVVGPLLDAPNKVAFLRRSPAPLVREYQRPTIRRRARHRMADPFNQRVYATWISNHRALAQQNRQGRLVSGSGKLELIKHLYEAEDAQQRQGINLPRSKRLPNRNTFDHEGRAGQARRGDAPGPSRLGDWVDFWTGPLIPTLGRFRRRFGRVFVSVSSKIQRLRQKLQDRVDGQRRRARGGGRSFGAIAIRALWRAVVSITSGVLRRTFEVLLDSLISGIRKKLEALLPMDDIGKMKEAVTGPNSVIGRLLQRINLIQTTIQSKIDEVEAWFEGHLSGIRSLESKARTFGDIIKWGNRIIQCGTPPLLGCIKLFFRAAVAWAVEKVLNLCRIKKVFADLAASTGWFNSLPAQLAGKVAEKAHEVLPSDLTPIFDEDLIRRQATFTFDASRDVDCSDTRADTELDHWARLESEIGTALMNKIIEALQKYGIPGDTRLEAEQVQAIRDAAINSGISLSELSNFIENVPRPVEGRAVDLESFLQQVRLWAAGRSAPARRPTSIDEVLVVQNPALLPGPANIGGTIFLDHPLRGRSRIELVPIVNFRLWLDSMQLEDRRDIFRDNPGRFPIINEENQSTVPLLRIHFDGP